jgi:hypothetical protein
MVIVLIFASILGGAISFAVLLWSYGVLLAVVGAPFGASLITLIVAALSARGMSADHDTALTTDEMLAALREKTGQARRYETGQTVRDEAA